MEKSFYLYPYQGFLYFFRITYMFIICPILVFINTQPPPPMKKKKKFCLTSYYFWCPRCVLVALLIFVCVNFGYSEAFFGDYLWVNPCSTSRSSNIFDFTIFEYYNLWNANIRENVSFLPNGPGSVVYQQIVILQNCNLIRAYLCLWLPFGESSCYDRG